jgi:hypothetical protein
MGPNIDPASRNFDGNVIATVAMRGLYPDISRYVQTRCNRQYDDRQKHEQQA